MNMVNKKLESPRHIAATENKFLFVEILYALHAVRAERCKIPLATCNDGCTLHGEFNGIPPDNCAFFKKKETCRYTTFILYVLSFLAR